MAGTTTDEALPFKHPISLAHSGCVVVAAPGTATAIGQTTNGTLVSKAYR